MSVCLLLITVRSALFVRMSSARVAAQPLIGIFDANAEQDACRRTNTFGFWDPHVNTSGKVQGKEVL